MASCLVVSTTVGIHRSQFNKSKQSLESDQIILQFLYCDVSGDEVGGTFKKQENKKKTTQE